MTEGEESGRAGEALRVELCGRAGAAAFGNPALGFDALMAELVYANVWDRTGLARADRMAVTIGVLCAMQNQVQLRRHVGAALDPGLSPRAVVEILVQTGSDCGLAASESATEKELEIGREHV